MQSLWRLDKYETIGKKNRTHTLDLHTSFTEFPLTITNDPFICIFIRELSFFTGRGEGASVCGGGDQNLLGWSKGGTIFFSGGTRIF